jgi:hypothetical protein
VITDFPIWLAAATNVDALALPAESPASVADLAATFGARTLIISGDDRGGWPGVLAAGGPGSDCFQLVDIGVPADDEAARSLNGTRVFRITCP